MRLPSLGDIDAYLEMEKIHSMFPRVEELSQLIPTLLDNVSAIWSQVAHVIYNLESEKI